MNPIRPLPESLADVPAFLARIAQYIDSSLVGWAGPGWAWTALWGALIAATFIALSAAYAVWARRTT